MIRRLLRWLDLDRWNDGYEQGYEDGWHDATVKAAVRVERDPIVIDPKITDDIEWEPR